MKASGLRGTPDPALLELAAYEGRILITSNRNTMTLHFPERLDRGLPTSGVFILPQQWSIGEIIEFLLLVWAASEPEEWRDRIEYLPFP